MLPIGLQLTLFDRGASGVPTRNNPVQPLLTHYDDSIKTRFGFESCNATFDTSPAEALDWLRAGLLRHMEATKPNGTLRWEGTLYSITITYGPIRIARSLENMANRITVAYATDGGEHGKTTTVTSAASIAEYGTKDLLIDLSTVDAAAATNRGLTELGVLAWPQSDDATALGGRDGGGCTVELVGVGYYELLDWVLTTNTAQTLTATNTQAANLLTTYNAVNTYFSSDTSGIVATGISDTVYIEPFTSIRDKLETILSIGTAAHEHLTWGIYADRALTVKVWAGATPSTITYYRHASDRSVRDASDNVIPPWDWLPDAMAQDVVILDGSPAADQIASHAREYIQRVTLKIDASGVSGTLEAGTLTSTSVAAKTEKPLGDGPAGNSSRQSKISRALKKTTRTTHPDSDNPRVPIITGGGSIDTGGGVITYPPPSGGPGSSVSGITGSGTIGAVAKWTATGELGNATAGTDYANASHNHAAGDITSGTMATARLGSGTASSSTFLRGDSTWQAISTIPPSTIGAAPDDAKYIVQTASSGLSAEQALGSLATGLLKNTTTTGVLSIAVAGTDYAAASHTHDASDVVSGVLGTARLGSGTASSTRFLRGDSTWQLISTITPADVGAAPDDAKYIVQTASSGLSAEQALGALATGLLKNTTTTGVLSIATAADLPAHASRHANGGADEVAIDTSQITSGTMAPARLGSGTANSTKYLAGDSTWTTFPNVITGTGAAPSGSNYSVAYWDGTGSLAADSSGLIFNPSSNRLGIGAAPTKTLEVNGNAIIGGGLISADLGDGLTASAGQIHASSTIVSDDGFSTGFATWDFRTFTAAGDAASNGHLTVVVGGTTYKLMTKA